MLEGAIDGAGVGEAAGAADTGDEAALDTTAADSWAISGGKSSTTAFAGSTEADQFHEHGATQAHERHDDGLVHNHEWAVTAK